MVYMSIATAKQPPGKRAPGKHASTASAASEGGRDTIVLKRGPGLQSVVVMGCFVAFAALVYLRWPSPYMFERILPSFVLIWSGYLFWEDEQEVVLNADSVSVHRTNWHSRVLGLESRKNVYSQAVSSVYIYAEPLRCTGRVGRQVFITFEDGIEVPLTGHCTFDKEADHMKVALAAADFYKLQEPPAIVKAPT